MSKAALIQSEERHLRDLIANHPGSVVIGGTTYAGAVILKRGPVRDSRGGFVQGFQLHFYTNYKRITEATLIDATTEKGKRLTITHLGKSYRLTDGGVMFDPHRTRWMLSAEEAVK